MINSDPRSQVSGADDDAADLAYDGRTRRLYDNTLSDFSQRLYMLLAEHSEGMTFDQIHEDLRRGWLWTDAYRGYEKHRQYARAAYQQRRNACSSSGDQSNVRRSGVAPMEYGSPTFQRAAQRWYIVHRLNQLRKGAIVRREGAGRMARWYVGDRVPRVRNPHTGPTGPTILLDVEAERRRRAADTEQHVRREQMKARLLADLNRYDELVKATRANTEHLLGTIRAAFEYLSGR